MELSVEAMLCLDGVRRKKEEGREEPDTARFAPGDVRPGDVTFPVVPDPDQNRPKNRPQSLQLIS